MKLIWHGTASVEIAGKGGRLLFDPFVPLPGSDVPVKFAPDKQSDAELILQLFHGSGERWL